MLNLPPNSLNYLCGMNSLPTITPGKSSSRRRAVAVAPSRTAEIVAPGASEMTVGPIQISDTEISGDETVTVSTTVEGNVAYIHTALYFWDEATESYWIGDVSYYVADNTTTIDGVNYAGLWRKPGAGAV